ncbi:MULTISPECIES: hypothetical protein [Pseudoxanthomonas]|jgi:hypothetical protein|uniref:Cytochrome c n=1 Tax=Pseudoxanthomonas winnipegensis TaxID=2480810 RepID=A0A4Q8L7Z0_9GAMM|nr:MULTISPECIES: hypothetical protein [Pseudoxanthomonas]PZP63102.1 MAG: hypothetical protein DI597_03410 [Pseudoxanthomonas spadix]TAA23726.1 hypothetical protein EA660_13945 [Pseudoxanthomonas winnipegensis]TMN17903.1 hypothetical protein FF950_16060 [Pseudoxanthomonas sp. X-1]UAY76457.1 hypothetical protein LAJ50_09625 [Pseudoxanthomonas sp. X-1]
MASQASRFLFLFLLGLLVGGVATVMAMRALQARQDPFPDSVMHVMAKQTDVLKANLAANRCTASDALPRLQTLRAVSNDLETAFPDLAEDARFVTHAGQLRATLDGALSAPPVGCPDTKAVAARIGDACKACHDDFAR